ncbi:MAG: exodeoxyribonuclease V subunit gamma [Xanthomonadaceae bacterium]|nr:exodeoxyribonuclease V subunit gamma [Xanthomonadaceae bacterium]
MKQYPAGLIVHRGSRTERLADELAAQLEAQRPVNPLATQTVVVAHPGLQRWLLGRIAQRSGPRGGHGIAANIEMILPWQWYERTARQVLGEEALIGGAYRHELLRWRLLMALPGLKAAEVSAYLAGDDAARRSFQLADHLAGVYTQYLIYRPDWIVQWEQAVQPGQDWQASLWRQVQAGIRRPHRAQRGAALLQALQTGGARAAGEPLHVFGVSHLPPDVLQALQATSLHAPVHLYFPDPCREYWSDLRSRRFQLKQQGDPEALYYEIGHPLLVALGRVPQDFCISLDECDAIEERDPLDEAEPLCEPTALLAQLQSSIRCLQPALVGAAFRAALSAGAGKDALLPPLRHDPSLRVHACHTRLRELEVLKDGLLRCLADDPRLQHRDIVVMAPDIHAYAPYLAAVFGEPAHYRNDPRHIPWHLADVGLARAHPLMSAFAQLLALAESRFTVSEVMDFLDVPAVARRFAIDAGGRDALERWLRRARVAWGLDAAMKAEVGAAACDGNSWQFGLDRLYAGLVVGQDHDADGLHETLLDGILPLDGVWGNAVEALGQLDRLLGELRRARHAFAGARPLAEWSHWLLQLIDALFLADLRDEAENGALDTLRKLAASLATQAAEAGIEAPLPWSVVREALRGALDAVPERQPFLLGGVTFCGLVPQRSIPFRVVCLLGMNEGEFPRPGHDAGLNRILGHPRHGDRDTRSEDRYLFLEALMSARDVLHVSYIGEGVRDGKPRNPAAPLVELLQFLDEQHDLAGDEHADRPWRIRHPLQPFDARYYERDACGQPRHDPRLFSYEPAFLATAPASTGPTPFLGPPPATPATTAGGEITLGALKRFWRDPVRDTLLHGQGISLQALDDDGWPDREPLETPLQKIERVDHRLLFEALAAGHAELPAEAPAWLARSGMLAGGAIGERTWTQLRDSLRPLLAQALPLFADNRAQAQTRAIDLDLGDGLRLTGTVDRVFRGADDGLLWFDARPGRTANLKDLLDFYIDWACLKLTHAGDGTPMHATLLEQVRRTRGGSSVLVTQAAGMPDTILALEDEQLRHGLRRLTEACQTAAQQPLLFFPRTAQAWAASAAEERLAKAAAAWEGDGFNPGERDYAPGYAALLGRDLELFDTTSPAHRAFVAATALVCGVLDPARTHFLVEPQP